MLLANGLEELPSLERDLAGRAENQAANTISMVKLVHHGESERGGFSGTGLGEAKNIASGECERNRLCLNVSRVFEADRSDGVDEVIAESKLGKSLVGRKSGLSDRSRKHRGIV